MVGIRTLIFITPWSVTQRKAGIWEWILATLVSYAHFTDGKTETLEQLGQFPKVTLKVSNTGSDAEIQTPGMLDLEGFSGVFALALTARKLSEALHTAAGYFFILSFDGLGWLWSLCGKHEFVVSHNKSLLETSWEQTVNK